MSKFRINFIVFFCVLVFVGVLKRVRFWRLGVVFLETYCFIVIVLFFSSRLEEEVGFLVLGFRVLF